MKKLYLAASYDRYFEINKYRYVLEDLGYEVTSSWLTRPFRPYGSEDLTEDELEQTADVDISDLDDAGILVLFTESPDTGRGGKYVELGYAISRWMWIFLVGPRTNVFTYHCDVAQCDTFEELPDLLAHYVG